LVGSIRAKQVGTTVAHTIVVRGADLCAAPYA